MVVIKSIKEIMSKLEYCLTPTDTLFDALEIMNKKNLCQYINPNASFNSSVTYDDNREISSVRFEQK